ncbi:Uncharacterised protein [Mycobacteroides abscessus subsp. abscessus]|nr:Uncharacterised protein [Mycobacteroides abscessus subsp. abscessus]
MRNRECLRDLRPPAARDSAQLKFKCTRARVIPTYSRRRSSSTGSISPARDRACDMGRVPSASPTRNTASHSRPLAACSDASVTPCTVGGWRASARTRSSRTRPGRSSSG